LINIFDALDPEVLAIQLQQVQHYDMLMGWSLGGQLAAYLAQQYWIQTGIAKPLISLASNPCFVQHATWPLAMPRTDFQAFQQSYRQNAKACIKRFCYLLTQGDESAKKNWLSLQDLLQVQDETLMNRGLELLEKLNLVDILQNYTGRQLHLMAKQDVLVDYQITQDKPYLATKFIETAFVSGTHSFPVFQVNETTDKIVDFIERIF